MQALIKKKTHKKTVNVNLSTKIYCVSKLLLQHIEKEIYKR